MAEPAHSFRPSAVMQRRGTPAAGLEDFPTPPWATRALVTHVLCRPGCVELGHLVEQHAWEPACGRGHMARTLRETFRSVHATDVADWRGARVPRWHGQHAVQDFLQAGPPATPVDWIVTNPPFRLATEFVGRALGLGPRRGVAIFARTALIEGIGRFAGIYRDRPPAVVAQFVERVPLVKGRLDPRASTTTAYAWLVWQTDRPMLGTQLVWIPPCRKEIERDGDYDEGAE